jgi:hypothetical protein
MADETWFSLENVPGGWFAPETQPDGWFSKELLDAPSSSGSPYTLTVSTAAINLSGTSVALRLGRKIAVTSSAITLSGSAVNLKFGHGITVGASAVTLAGSTVALRSDKRIAAATNAVVLSGSSVNLTYTPAVGAKVITVNPGAIVLSGSIVNLTYSNPSSYGSGSSPFVFPKRGKKPKEPEITEPQIIEVPIISRVPKKTVERIVSRPIEKAKPKSPDVLRKLARDRFKSETARAEYYRRLQAMDDEWLLTA